MIDCGATVMTGIRSRSTLRPAPGLMIWFTTMELELTSTVWPSGSALATWRPAIPPAAPGRFSTTTLWPSRGESLSANRRAMTSTPPPGGKPTTRRIGRFG